MEDSAETIEQATQTRKIAGVRFRENWKVYDFDATDIDIVVGDRVIVDSERGPGFAHVVRIRRSQVPVVEAPPAAPAPPQEIPDGVEIDIDDVGKEPQAAAPTATGHAPRGVRRILRKATEDDFTKEEKNREREREAFLAGQDMVTERELPMRLVRVEYSFDASRATFFFFSETRIDFRELVKDLAHKLKSRIEMRQIGVRDVARMIGGFGPCGRELCCSSFLKNFEPVSIRMAKKQEMVLNPAKISGVCGRLLCCLSYEYEMYDEIKKDLADMGAAAAKEKKEQKDKEEQRIAEERREADDRRLADEKKRQEERKHQEPRREKRPEGGQKGGGRPEKDREQQERKAQSQSERTREQGQGRQQEQKARQPEQKAKPQEQKAGQPEQKADQLQQPQQAGEKSGKKKRRRFWRKKKKGQSGENKPQGPGTPAGG